MLPFLKNHILALKIVIGAIVALMMLDFLLLVTSIEFRWWVPVWGNAIVRQMLIYRIVVATIISLLQMARIWFSARTYKRQGYSHLIVPRIVASVEGAALSLLFAMWGVLSLMGQISDLPLKMLAIVYVTGFFAFAALQIYDLRRKRRHSLQ